MFQDKMTIFYKKRNGDIISVLDGEHDMSMYGDMEEDYSLIYDFIVIPNTVSLHRNFNLYIVKDNEVSIREDVPLLIK
jgi:hypothetical protein